MSPLASRRAALVDWRSRPPAALELESKQFEACPIVLLRGGSPHRNPVEQQAGHPPGAGPRGGNRPVEAFPASHRIARTTKTSASAPESCGAARDGPCRDQISAEVESRNCNVHNPRSSRP